MNLGGRNGFKSDGVSNEWQINKADESEGGDLSLPRISKVEIEEWGEGCALYIWGKMRERRSDALIQKWSQRERAMCPKH